MNTSKNTLSMAEFAETVKENVLTHLPEDYQDRKVRIDEIVKEGDRKLTGLTLIKEGCSTAPVLYINGFYEMYEDGCTESDVLDAIAETYVKIQTENPQQFTIPDLSYENVKPLLRVSVVYDRANSKLLERLVSVPVGCGYSLIAWLELGDLMFDGATIKITRDIFEKFDVSEGQLFKDALEASAQENPATLLSLLDAMMTAAGGEKSANILDGEMPDHEHDILVLTSKDRFSGASALFYPGMTERIAEIMGGSFFVIPSSVHEVLIKPDDGSMSPLELARMVKTVNDEAVSPSERLGNRVLYYDEEAKTLSVAYDLDKEERKTAVC